MRTPPGSLLILTEGSVRTGTGHLRRCATLARHLQSQGWEITFQVLGKADQRLSQDAIQHILNGLKWQALAQPVPLPANVTMVDMTAFRQKETVAWCQDQGLVCLALDYQQADMLPDAVVTLKDLSGHMHEAFMRAGRASSYHEGVEYAVIRPSLMAQRARCLLPGQNGVSNAVITIGGADPGGLTLEAMNLLRPWRNRLDQVTVVLGPGVNDALIQQARLEAAGLDFKIERSPPDFDGLLGSADLVLCNGGGTMLEALCIGRLVAVLPQNAAEIAFATGFCHEKACIWAHEVGKILEATKQERLEFASRAASIVDGNGLERLATLITQMANPEN